MYACLVVMGFRLPADRLQREAGRGRSARGGETPPYRQSRAGLHGQAQHALLDALRAEQGLAAANHAARRLVAAPYRSGGQAQFVPRRVPALNDERLSATREWTLARLHEPLTIAMLSGHALVSQRTFSRAFLEETGYTPMRWVMRARLDLARELLENTQLSIDEVAASVGLGTGTNLRLHFRSVLGTTPSEYRRTFTKGE